MSTEQPAALSTAAQPDSAEQPAMASQAAPEAHRACMREGDYIIIDENGGDKCALGIVKKNGNIRVARFNLPMAPIVGAPFGSVWEISPDGKRLQRVTQPPRLTEVRIEETVRNNAGLVDANSANQALGQDEIAQLRQTAEGGRDIVAALCESSATFAGKTEFSQEKYKKRKEKKYCITITLRRPTARSVCQNFFDKGPARVFNLRPDSLALALAMANVTAHGRTLVLEACQGLVVAAALERCGGYGTVCSATTSHMAAQAPVDSVRFMNFDKCVTDCLCTATVSDLRRFAALTEKPEAPAPAPAPAAADAPAQAERAAAGESAMEVDAPAATAATAASSSGAAEGGAKAGGKRGDAGGAPREGYRASQSLLYDLTHPGFTSCMVVAPRYDATAILEELWPLLAPSASFAVFSPWAQPLAEALLELQKARKAAALQLSESWLRPYQVLPGRTHPHMSMTGTGGYLLYGIKVDHSLGGGSANGGANGAKRAADSPAAAQGAEKKLKAEEAAAAS